MNKVTKRKVKLMLHGTYNKTRVPAKNKLKKLTANM